MKKYLFYCLTLCTIIAVGCQKEFSFEGPNSPAEGSLQADITGDCLPKTVNGVYEAVSYTHLRAHETVLDLVCRLLLEKKKK